MMPLIATTISSEIIASAGIDTTTWKATFKANFLESMKSAIGEDKYNSEMVVDGVDTMSNLATAIADVSVQHLESSIKAITDKIVTAILAATVTSTGTSVTVCGAGPGTGVVNSTGTIT